MYMVTHIIVVKMLIPYISASSLEYQKISVRLQIDQLLYHVKEKFSEVLLPVETVIKLEMFGKGKIKLNFYYLRSCYDNSYIHI